MIRIHDAASDACCCVGTPCKKISDNRRAVWGFGVTHQSKGAQRVHHRDGVSGGRLGKRIATYAKTASKHGLGVQKFPFSQCHPVGGCVGTTLILRVICRYLQLLHEKPAYTLLLMLVVEPRCVVSPVGVLFLVTHIPSPDV